MLHVKEAVAGSDVGNVYAQCTLTNDTVMLLFWVQGLQEDNWLESLNVYISDKHNVYCTV